ncbi:MAG TPA: DUF2087 domain-containing protein, partial [Chthonomonadaceae bacterium]|nr:DUF2087 domain-containing protein [Chthonomonadaceae bacterium]
VYALRQIGDEEAVRVLRQAAQSSVTGLPQAASHALHTLSNGQPQEVEAPSRPGSFRMSEVVRGNSKPSQYISLETVMRALPEVRPYSEHEITRLIAQVCFDYSSTRRYLIEEGLFFREQGRYELTEIGRTVWRVERFIQHHYIRGI